MKNTINQYSTTNTFCVYVFISVFIMQFMCSALLVFIDNNCNEQKDNHIITKYITHYTVYLLLMH